MGKGESSLQRRRSFVLVSHDREPVISRPCTQQKQFSLRRTYSLPTIGPQYPLSEVYKPKAYKTFQLSSYVRDTSWWDLRYTSPIKWPQYQYSYRSTYMDPLYHHWWSYPAAFRYAWTSPDPPYDATWAGYRDMYAYRPSYYSNPRRSYHPRHIWREYTPMGIYKPSRYLRYSYRY